MAELYQPTQEIASERMRQRRAAIAEAAGQTALLPEWQREAYFRAFDAAEKEASSIENYDSLRQ